MGRWIYLAIAAAVVILAILYFSKAWAAYTKPQGAIVTTDPALQRDIWKMGTAYGESIPMDR